jgi:hypothetical protein
MQDAASTVFFFCTQGKQMPHLREIYDDMNKDSSSDESEEEDPSMQFVNDFKATRGQLAGGGKAKRGRSKSPTKKKAKKGKSTSPAKKKAKRGSSKSPTKRGRSKSPAKKAKRGRSKSPTKKAKRGRSKSPAKKKKYATAKTLHGKYRQVWEGKAEMSGPNGQRKSDLKLNKKGIPVSAKKSKLGNKNPWIVFSSRLRNSDDASAEYTDKDGVTNTYYRHENPKNPKMPFIKKKKPRGFVEYY